MHHTFNSDKGIQFIVVWFVWIETIQCYTQLYMMISFMCKWLAYIEQCKQVCLADYIRDIKVIPIVILVSIPPLLYLTPRKRIKTHLFHLHCYFLTPPSPLHDLLFSYMMDLSRFSLSSFSLKFGMSSFFLYYLPCPLSRSLPLLWWGHNREDEA